MCAIEARNTKSRSYEYKSESGGSRSIESTKWEELRRTKVIREKGRVRQESGGMEGELRF